MVIKRRYKIKDMFIDAYKETICAAIGFSLINLLNETSDKINLSPLYLCIVAFCFSMTIGVLWEFFEYSADKFFKLDMQKDNIITEISSVELDPKKIIILSLLKI